MLGWPGGLNAGKDSCEEGARAARRFFPSPVIRPTESLPSLSPSYISRHGSHPVLHQSTAHVQLMA